jgi:hypothetical protein
MTPTRTTSTATTMRTAKKRKSSNPSAVTTSWKKFRNAPSVRAGSIKFRK